MGNLLVIISSIGVIVSVGLGSDGEGVLMMDLMV